MHNLLDRGITMTRCFFINVYLGLKLYPTLWILLVFEFVL
jgi:hypothetical protein